MKMLRVRTAALPMLGLSLGLLLSACGGTDDSAAVSGAGAGEVAVEASDDSDAVSDAGAGEVAVEASDDATPGTDLVEADDPVGNDTPEALAVRPDSVVTWLDTEFRIPAPWSVRATDGGAVWLEHPSAAGQGGSVYVYMLAEDGQLTAEHVAGNLPVTASGEVMQTKELDAVFATGGPGLQVGAARSQLVSIFSDTGISVSINRDEGTLTEEAVATVLALLATIEPPAVTPSTEAVVGLEAGLREIGLDIPRDTCAFYNDPATPPDGKGNFDGLFIVVCNTRDPAIREAGFAAFAERRADILGRTLNLCPLRREQARSGPPSGYGLWYPDGRLEHDCTWRPKSGG